jgi:GT2 family glycosyltransferase
VGIRMPTVDARGTLPPPRFRPARGKAVSLHGDWRLVMKSPDAAWTAEPQHGRAGDACLYRFNGHPTLFVVDGSGNSGTAAVQTGTTDADVIDGVAAMILASIERLPPPPERSLTVAICTKDRPEPLARCMTSLTGIGGIDPRSVLVVDNAPADGRTADVARAAGVAYVVEPLAGLDFARNRALATAATDWLAFIDDDAVADAGWLDGLRRAWARNPDAKGVTGFVLPYALDTDAQVMFELNGGFRRGVVPARFEPDIPGDPFHPCNSGRIGAGCNMAFDRGFLVAIGGFDEALDTGRPLPGGGDLDIFFRVLHAGGVMAYEPSMIVRHEHRATREQLRRQYWSWGLGLMAFLDKASTMDPVLRRRARALRRWWLDYTMRRMAKRVLRSQGLPLDMLFAELFGGIQGYFGEYRRSRRRSDTLRRNG